MSGKHPKRAVILAAGEGSRLRPLTLETPKPLLEVRGKRIIDTIIDALIDNGIEDIYIVRRYKAEAFDVLLEKYPALHFLDRHPDDCGNNILSVLRAGDLLSDAFVLPGDIYIRNPEIFAGEQTRSNVLAFPVEHALEWCVETDDDGKVIHLDIEGSNCFQSTGIFYWNEQDGKHLAECVEKSCRDASNRNRFWYWLPFEDYKDDFCVHVRKCGHGDVVEIDTLDDLARFDPAHRNSIAADEEGVQNNA